MITMPPLTPRECRVSPPPGTRHPLRFRPAVATRLRRPVPVATSRWNLPRSYKFAPTDIAVAVDTTVAWTYKDQLHQLRPPA